MLEILMIFPRLCHIVYLLCPVMNKEWRNYARNRSFNMTISEPSKILKNIKHSLWKALDLWSWKFRNSIFLAYKWYDVTAVDIADLSDDYLKIPQKIRSKINYEIKDLSTYNIHGQFDVVVAARLFQYIPYEKIVDILVDVFNSLKDDGKFYISINTDWGIFNQPQIDVSKYKHNIDKLVDDIKNIWFSIELLKNGSSKNIGVNYQDDIISYDIICKK